MEELVQARVGWSRSSYVAHPSIRWSSALAAAGRRVCTSEGRMQDGMADFGRRAGWGWVAAIVTLKHRAEAPRLGVPCRRRWRGESGFIFAHAVEAGVHAWSGRVFQRVVEVMEGPCVQCSEEEVGSTQIEAMVLQR